MATIATTFKLVDKVSSPMGKIINSVKQSTKGFESMAGKIVSVNSALDLLGRGAEVIKKVGSFFGSFVSDASEYENLLSNLTVTMGDAISAQQEFNKLKSLADTTPFNLPDVVNASIMLRNVGVESEKIIPTIRMLGDASRGSKEAFNSIIMNYSQIQSIGKASMMDMKQFAGQMLPVFDLMQEMGIEGQATAEQVEEMFVRMTSSGGKFYKGMEIASKTLSGKTSTLKDEIQGISATIGNQLLPIMKELTDSLRNILRDIQQSKVFRTIVVKIKETAQKIKNNLDSIIATMIRVGTVATIVGTTMAVAWAVAHWPLTLILIAIITIIRAMNDLSVSANETSKAMTGSFNQVSQALSTLGGVIGGISAFVGGLFNIIYNFVAVIYNALMTVSELIYNVFTGHWSVFGSFFIDLGSTILEILAQITGAIDFMFGTSMTEGLKNADRKIQEFKNNHFQSTYKYDRMELKDVSGLVDSIKQGAKMGEEAGRIIDNNLTFQTYDPWAGDDVPEYYKELMKLQTDSNGNLKVAVQNDLKISDEYKQLLAQREVEKYKVRYSQSTPQINFGNINISETVDANKVLDMIATGLSELASSDLTL